MNYLLIYFIHQYSARCQCCGPSLKILTCYKNGQLSEEQPLTSKMRTGNEKISIHGFIYQDRHSKSSHNKLFEDLHFMVKVNMFDLKKSPVRVIYTYVCGILLGKCVSECLGKVIVVAWQFYWCICFIPGTVPFVVRGVQLSLFDNANGRERVTTLARIPRSSPLMMKMMTSADAAVKLAVVMIKMMTSTDRTVTLAVVIMKMKMMIIKMMTIADTAVKLAVVIITMMTSTDRKVTLPVVMAMMMMIMMMMKTSTDREVTLAEMMMTKMTTTL